MWRFVSLVILLWGGHFTDGWALENLRFHGSLVAQPCVIEPGDEHIELDFGSVIDKYLYINQRTHSQPFVIRLSKCNLALGKMVSLSFLGTESVGAPGKLALDATSQASGIAIGIEDREGKAILINQGNSSRYPLQSGVNRIILHAWVEAEQEALSTKSIVRGPFSAVVTFKLNYE
ncbi:fimbrial protein [Klebsiella aerogenes]|uniref:fimbrial protein n=1 Tax=Klebsiella aerogenes TaxID=548 RepID=UPI001CC6CE19|nr:fimbrial protein [Klebsiella aerogenes]MCR1574215.1 type 1 fimbrial protein [Klebsiella aerogenes]UNX72889.1 type 1 fimbrial protein [Klebsiella aerogenes]